MDDHISLLIGTGVGLFSGWILCWMYFAGRIQEVMDDTRDEARKKLDALNESLHKKDIQIDDSKRSFQMVLDERSKLRFDLAEESAKRTKLEEKANMIPLLERKIGEMETKVVDFAVLQEKLTLREGQIQELKVNSDRISLECERVKQDLAEQTSRRLTIEERLRHFQTLEEKAKSLEKENSKLNRENAELRRVAEDFSKLADVKNLYEKALEENGFLRQQHFVRSFLEIKSGIDQTIKAYNRIYGMFDKKMLTESDYSTAQEIETPEPPECTETPEPPRNFAMPQPSTGENCGVDTDGMEDEPLGDNDPN